MNNTTINKNLIIKIISFFRKAKSLYYLDTNIFKNIDAYKEANDVNFNDYYLEYISSLPKLDFETAIKISREVYQSYGKENEFDEVLNKLVSNCYIFNGSLNKDDDNCIIKASESKILLSGTYYDVILICHEIGHKLRSVDNINHSDIMGGFFFETPSIMLELSANDYLRNNYEIDINADELRKKHVSSIQRENGIENYVFLIVMKLLKERKLNALNLYIEFIKNPNAVEYFNRQGSSIEMCVEEGMSAYSYDIGYILGNYMKNSNNRNDLLDMILNYKDNGLKMPFSIDEEIIDEALSNQKYMK